MISEAEVTHSSLVMQLNEAGGAGGGGGTAAVAAGSAALMRPTAPPRAVATDSPSRLLPPQSSASSVAHAWAHSRGVPVYKSFVKPVFKKFRKRQLSVSPSSVLACSRPIQAEEREQR